MEQNFSLHNLSYLIKLKRRTKGKKMPKKTVKKTATVKKATVKKTASKKPATKKIVVEEVNEFVPEKHECACGHDCKCGCHGGSRFGRFLKKLIFFLIIFALGFGAAKLCDNGSDFRGPHAKFRNGCLVVSSVKCPQLQALLPVMDMNQDGCISRAEYRAVRNEFRAQVRAGMNMNR